MHWTDRRIEGVVCCVQRSRTFCGHSLDFPPHSHPPSPLGLFLCKHGALVNQSWPHLERFCILSEQFAALHTLFAALYSIEVYSSSSIYAIEASLCASTSERPLSAAAAAASLQQDQQLTWCQCHALQAAHCSAAHLHQVTELVIVCQCTLRTHDQLSTTLQKQKKPSTFDCSL